MEQTLYFSLFLSFWYVMSLPARRSSIPSHASSLIFAFNPATDVLKLRKSHRILGQLVGQLPSDSLAPKALSNQGLPLVLSPYEVYIGVDQGYIRIVRNVAKNQPNTEPATKRPLNKSVVISTQRHQDNYYAYEDVDHITLYNSFFSDIVHGEKRNIILKTFLHLWLTGFYVQTSSHFHTDLVVYTADPILVHASFLVICVTNGQKLRLRDLMSYGRLASTVKKTLLLASDKNASKIQPLQRQNSLPTSIPSLNPSQASSDPTFMTQSSPTQPQQLLSASMGGSTSNNIQESEIIFLEFSWAGVS
jgi:tRNA splicing endonuclease